MANKEVKLGDFLVTETSPVYFIAEIGLNHNGDLQIAKRLIDAAFACGWHCVKFQKRNPDVCVPEHQKGVMRDTPWGQMTYLDYRYKVEFGAEEYSYIDAYSKEKPIQWTASVWDLDSLSFIARYGAAFIKMPSALITNHLLLTEACRTGLPVIASTGMSTVEEIDAAVNILEKETNGDYLLLHTNSAYPSPPEDINLNVIPFLRNRYHCLVGYSGHEYDLEPTVIATSLGARVIERHITLDHHMWGSDQFASLEVHAMSMLINRCKDVQKLMGDGVKRVSGKELEVRKKLRG